MAEYLKKILPPGSKVYVIVAAMRDGTRKVKYLAVNNGEPDDITHMIFRKLNLADRKYDSQLSLIITTDPDNVVTTLALDLYNDHKSLTPVRL